MIRYIVRDRANAELGAGVKHKWRRWLAGFAALAFCAAIPAQAPKEVPVAEEPRHHFVFENGVIRAFRVEVAPNDRTLLHRHDRDYFFISIGAAELTNAVLGRAEVALRMEDEQMGFTKGGFAHVAINRGSTPFRNFTIEFKQRQSKLTNYCARADQTAALNCTKKEDGGGQVTPEFETEHASVALLRVKPGAQMELAQPELPRLLMPIDQVDAHVQAGGKKTPITSGKEMWLAGGSASTLVNTGTSPARLLSIVIKATAK